VTATFKKGIIILTYYGKMEVKGMLFFQIDSIDRPIFNEFFTKFPNDYLETEDDGIFGMEDLLQITLTLSAASLPYVL